MLDAAVAASTVSTLGVGLNGLGQLAGARPQPPGTPAAGERGGFAASGQTISPAITAGLSTAATAFLQAPGISQAPVDGQSTDNDPARQRQNPLVELVEAVASGENEEEGGAGSNTPDNPDRSSRARAQAEDAEAARATLNTTNEEGPDGLTDAERQQVRELQRIDAEIRRHEEAHANVGGPYAGAPRYQYVTGPDGKQYAVSGQVSIDASPIPGNPEATIQKLRIVQRAALAPAEPSSQDRQVAATAQRGILEARQELAQERAEQLAERAADNGAEVIGENIGAFRNDALATPLLDRALESGFVTPDGVSAAAASQALLRASSLTLQSPPDLAAATSGGTTAAAIDPGTLFNLTV